MLRASLLLIGLLLCSPLSAQTFDSGSNGSDGALTIAGGQGTIVFDPRNFSPQLDPDNDGVYHFTTITVGLGTTVKLTASVLGEGKPVIWLAQGAVLIDGVLDLNGANGHNFNGLHVPSVAGAGGYNGGIGNDEAVQLAATAGNGPGGGLLPTPAGVFVGFGAGHLVRGGGSGANGGRTYGNAFLMPLIGGSGGAGGGVDNVDNTGRGAGGGAGGGALLLASSASITLNGSISANGGTGGSTTSGGFGGGGSGGAIRLMAPDLAGSGSVSALGWSSGVAQTSSNGRIRLEAFRYANTLTLTPAFSNVTAPGPVFAPASSPVITVTQVDAQPVPANPTGSASSPDVTITANTDVTITINTQNVPVGTPLEVTIQPQTGTAVVTTVNVVGPVANSTQSVSVRIESGVSRVLVRANWTP